MTLSFFDFQSLVADSPIPWPADLVLRATVILALAGLLAAVLRRAPAAARHALWAAALLGILLIPLVLLFPGWHVIPVPAKPAPVLVAAPAVVPEPILVDHPQDSHAFHWRSRPSPSRYPKRRDSWPKTPRMIRRSDLSMTPSPRPPHNLN